MLSLHIKNLSLKDKIIDIHEVITKIQSTVVVDTIRKLIFTKTKYHNVKCLSYDITWCIKIHFTPVLDAIIKLSSIIFALRRYIKTLNNDIIRKQSDNCLKYICDIYHFLKEGLREYGCYNPPFITGTILKENDIIDAAIMINTEWLKRDDHDKIE